MHKNKNIILLLVVPEASIVTLSIEAQSSNRKEAQPLVTDSIKLRRKSKRLCKIIQ